jgi:hypothetical protein
MANNSEEGQGSQRVLVPMMMMMRNVSLSPHPDDRGAKFLQNIGSYKSHTA